MGGVQGLTEFLPVSSTTHINLLQRKLSHEAVTLSWDTALHLGSLLATTEWLYQERSRLPLRQRGFWYRLALGTLPAVGAGLLLEKPLNRWRTAQLSAVLSGLGALSLLHLAWRPPPVPPLTLPQLSYRQTLLIGCAQASALLPGLSRSGMTQWAGQSLGLAAADAQRFSFALSVPVVAGSALFEMRHLSGRDLRRLWPGLLSATLSSKLMLHRAHSLCSRPAHLMLGLYRLTLAIYLWREARKNAPSR